MPNQLYGRIADKSDPSEQANQQAGQAPNLGLGTASLGASPNQASSPYANFEDIFNKNKNVAAASADKTVGAVADPLKGLSGRGVPQTLAPTGHAEMLNLPGHTAASAGPQGQVNTGVVSKAAQAPTLQQTQDAVQTTLSKPATQPGENPQVAGNNILGGYGPASQDPQPPPPPPPPEPPAQGEVAAQGEYTDPNTNKSPLAPVVVDGPMKNAAGLPPGTKGAHPTAVDSVLAEIQAANEKDANAIREEESALGKYRKASDQIASYNQDEGLDLMKQADPNATIWDAALMNQAGGRDAFDTLEQAFGGYDREYAKQVGKDRDARTAELNALNRKLGGAMNDAKRGAELAKANPQTPQTGAAKSNVPTKSLRDMLYAGGDSFWSDMHQAGLTMSPADWASIWAAAETGNDLPMPTEEFAGNFDLTGGAIKRTWPQAKLQMAWGVLTKEFSPEATAALLAAMEQNPDMMNAYLAMKNPGFMLRSMRQWLASAGYTKSNAGKQELKYSDPADAESVRRRLAMGYEMTDADGHTWKTLEEYDAAHRGQ